MDGIETEHAGQLRVFRLNVQDPPGKLLGQELGFRFTPTFVLFDADGNEIWRAVGAIEPQQIRNALGS